MHFCFDVFCFSVFLCWGASVGIVSVLFLSSTGQPHAYSVCSKDVEPKQNTWVRFLQWSVLLAGSLISISVSFLPYCPDPVIALRFKNQIPYFNKIKASYLILLIFQFWWQGKKKVKARVHLLVVSTSSSHWRWQQTRWLLIAAEIFLGILTFQSPQICKFYAFFFFLSVFTSPNNR